MECKVKGHTRRLKNGKTATVKGYTRKGKKGKKDSRSKEQIEKDIASGKEYERYKRFKKASEDHWAKRGGGPGFVSYKEHLAELRGK